MWGDTTHAPKKIALGHHRHCLKNMNVANSLARAYQASKFFN